MAKSNIKPNTLGDLEARINILEAKVVIKPEKPKKVVEAVKTKKS